MTSEVIPASGGYERSCYVSEYEFNYKSRTRCFHSEEVIRLHITNNGINQYPELSRGLVALKRMQYYFCIVLAKMHNLFKSMRK